jgi:hypothetical protein
MCSAPLAHADERAVNPASGIKVLLGLHLPRHKARHGDSCSLLVKAMRKLMHVGAGNPAPADGGHALAPRAIPPQVLGGKLQVENLHGSECYTWLLWCHGLRYAGPCTLPLQSSHGLNGKPNLKSQVQAAGNKSQGICSWHQSHVCKELQEYALLGIMNHTSLDDVLEALSDDLSAVISKNRHTVVF